MLCRARNLDQSRGMRALVKAHICDQDDVPSDETHDCRDTGEPLEDGTSIMVNVKIRQESRKH